jgi:hypothetical protein
VIPSPILKAETELRRVLERRQAGDIFKCITAYGEIAENQIKSLHPGDPIRRQVCERVLSVLKWARLMLQTRRATIAEELRLLRKVDRFLGDKPSAVPQVQLDL